MPLSATAAAAYRSAASASPAGSKKPSTRARWRTRVCLCAGSCRHKKESRACGRSATDPPMPHRTPTCIPPWHDCHHCQPCRCTHDWATALVALCFDLWPFTGRAVDTLLTRHLTGGKSRRPTMPMCFLTCPTARSRRCNVRKQTRRARACLPTAAYSKPIAGRQACGR